MLNLKNYKELPKNKETSEKWSLSTAINLKTIRDVFIFVAKQKSTTKNELYTAMYEGVIKPPKDKWSRINPKKKDRTPLEYLHTNELLFLLKEESKIIYIEEKHFIVQKQIITSENLNRDLKNEIESPELTKNEQQAFLEILFNFTKIKEYLYWFLDFEKFEHCNDFTIDEFKNNSKEIYLLDSYKSNGKASDFIKRGIDNLSNLWKIPYEEVIENNNIRRINDYTRFASDIAPKWLSEVGLINTLKIYKDYNLDNQEWRLHYPIKDEDVDINTFKNFIIEYLNTQKDKKAWIPNLLIECAIKFFLPIHIIKEKIISLFTNYSDMFEMPRSSLQVIKYSNRIRQKKNILDSVNEKMLIKYNGFYRTYFKFKS